jgi:hypothetical protein
MARRFVSDLNAFWDNAAAVGAGANSSVVELSRGISNFMIWVTSSGATEIFVEIGMSPDIVGGVEQDPPPGTWFDLLYLEQADTDRQKIVFAGAGSRALLIPDIAFRFVRLRNLTAGVTLTAGYSGVAD